MLLRLVRFFRSLGQRRWKSWSRSLYWLLLALAMGLVLAQGAPAASPTDNNYSLARQAAFNRVEEFPIKSLPSTANYRPTGEWVGRLILPTVEEYRQTPGDWAWFEVWNAPVAEPNLLGQKVRLTWVPGSQSETLIKQVTRDVEFTEPANKAAANGIIVPTRLNGRRAVGPLQSLAGARPKDDMTVRLEAAKLLLEGETAILQTALEPVQVTGREYALVKLIGPDTETKKPLPQACPGGPPCPSEYFKVQHYSFASDTFNGETETIRIPQQPNVEGDRFFSNIRDLLRSPAGEAGWYVYGARDAEGVFTVQALKPRALFQLRPDDVVLGPKAGLNYIDRQNWANTPDRKGRLQRVLVSPTAVEPEAAVQDWQDGDYALVLHLLGGIGGENREVSAAGTVPGHFAYGLARVVREPFTQELQLNLLYQQIYVHNSSGIIAGTHDWSSFMGDMQRGWLGQRPISDAVIKLDAFTEPLELGETTLSLSQELLVQAQVIAARYRIGDGTGLASITPATASVQDASQALYIAIQQIERQAKAEPTADWIKQNPNDPEVQQLQQFVQLGKALTKALTPYGVVRPDWQNNAEVLSGVEGRYGFALSNGLLSGILSWRSMMPRWAHDDISQFFLQQGAQIWFLRPNQLGGDDPTILPMAPTLLFGDVPVLGRVTKRLADAVAQPSWGNGSLIFAALLLYGAIALPYGLKSGFLRRYSAIRNPFRFGLDLVRLFFLPALVEEIIFRVMLLPHPAEGLSLGRWLLWAMLSLGLFVVYHFFSARTYYRPGNPTFFDRRFILLMAWLGVVLTFTYAATGSLWVVAIVHWVVVVVWLYGLGGLPRLLGKPPSRLGTPKPVQG